MVRGEASLDALACSIAAISTATLAAGPAKPPILLQSTGAYEVGGKVITNPADTNQTLSCDHGYPDRHLPWPMQGAKLVAVRVAHISQVHGTEFAFTQARGFFNRSASMRKGSVMKFPHLLR